MKRKSPKNTKIVLKRRKVVHQTSINFFRKIGTALKRFHQKFGYGYIRSIEDNKLYIDFEKAGKKKVISHFVEFPP